MEPDDGPFDSKPSRTTESGRQRDELHPRPANIATPYYMSICLPANNSSVDEGGGCSDLTCVTELSLLRTGTPSPRPPSASHIHVLFSLSPVFSSHLFLSGLLLSHVHLHIFCRTSSIPILCPTIPRAPRHLKPHQSCAFPPSCRPQLSCAHLGGWPTRRRYSD